MQGEHDTSRHLGVATQELRHLLHNFTSPPPVRFLRRSPALPYFFNTILLLFTCKTRMSTNTTQQNLPSTIPRASRSRPFLFFVGAQGGHGRACVGRGYGVCVEGERWLV